MLFSNDDLARQSKEIIQETDRRRGGKTISKSGQKWTLPAQLGQLKSGLDKKGLLRSHLCATTTFKGFAKEQNRTE